MLFERLARWLTRPKAADDLGSRGEQLAAQVLREQGYEVLALNWWCRRGEVDLICRTPERKALVFVEVKTRRSDEVSPEEQVNRRKQRQVAGAAAVYCRRFNGKLPPCRFDVVAVVWRDGEPPEVRHHEDAFAPADFG